MRKRAGNRYGRLRACIVKDFQLSKPAELDSYGSFRAPSDGNLYFRCADKWNELADNSGKLTVKLKRKDQGPPLKRS